MKLELLAAMFCISMLLGCASAPQPQGKGSPIMCTFDYAAFSCSSASLSADGKLSLAIKNEKETAFVHKIICTNSKSPTPPSFGTAFSAEPTIKSGESYSPENGIACLDQNGNALGKIPDDFSGKVWVFYNYASDGQDYPPRVSTASIAKIS